MGEANNYYDGTFFFQTFQKFEIYFNIFSLVFTCCPSNGDSESLSLLTKTCCG